tara:strand:- start:117 stop:437 length:321 start_codon:yes stop_codon:yes gene_type:complete
MENNPVKGQENLILIAKHFVQNNVYHSVENGIAHLVNQPNQKCHHPQMKIQIVELSVEKDLLALNNVKHGDVLIVFRPLLLIYPKHVNLQAPLVKKHALLPLHQLV